MWSLLTSDAYLLLLEQLVVLLDEGLDNDDALRRHLDAPVVTLPPPPPLPAPLDEWLRGGELRGTMDDFFGVYRSNLERGR